MKRGTALLLALAFSALQPAEGADVQAASGEVVLESATDDIQPMHSSSGEYPGRDVASLRIASDGSAIKLSATLTSEASGSMATDVVRVYVDTDNDSATGATATWTEQSGFEFIIELNLCIKYASGAEFCAGGAGDDVVGYFASPEVKDAATGQSDKAFWDLPQTPVEGNVVESTVPYSELGVTPGQTIRIYARESSGPYNESGYFPQIALTLN